MEATIIKAAIETTVQTESVDTKDFDAIVELSAHQLALVGGGTANVAFL